MQSQQSSKQLYQLLVDIRSAHDLENKKLIGSHAIYIAIDCNDETKRTSIKENEIDNIVWNESFVFEFSEIPNSIDFRVSDNRFIMPNIHLGQYSIPLKNKINDDLNSNKPLVIEDGIVNLEHVSNGKLNIRVVLQNNTLLSSSLPFSSSSSQNIASNYSENLQLFSSNLKEKYNQVQQNTFESIPSQALNNDITINDNGINNNINIDKKEVHILPTIHVYEQPTIIEKEVEYVKPIVIQQTIVHREQPIVVEQPTIIEKHEHYREETQVAHQESKIVRNVINDNSYDNGNNTRAEDVVIEELQNRRKSQYNDVTPIIEHEKERIIMDKEIKTEPTQVINKQVIYEQPVEVTKTTIEKVKPTVIENVTFEKEHVHEKLAPQLISENVQVINQGDQFYSQNENNMKNNNNEIDTR